MPDVCVFGTEMDAPRGRIAPMRAAVNGRLTEAFLDVRRTHHALSECRACEIACPSRAVWETDRGPGSLEDLRRPGLGERLVRWVGMEQLMPHRPDEASGAADVAYQAVGLQWVVRTANVLPSRCMVMEDPPPIALRFTDTSRPAPAIGEAWNAGLFYGCIRGVSGQHRAATIRVLQRNGYEAVPQSQTCCGAAQWHTGDEALAKDLARKNIDAFASYDIVVNNAGGCGFTLKVPRSASR